MQDAKTYISQECANNNMKLDNYEVCEADSLKPIAVINPNQKAISLIAVFVGNIRLIDNWMVN